VRRGNQRLSHVEQVRRILLLDRDLSQENGELTPSMKVKRKEVERMYAPQLDRLYSEEGFGLSI
jgi:long-chain acyl-CoA synthetase